MTETVKETIKKAKKLSKVIEGTVLTITEGVTNTVLKYDAKAFTPEIKERLMMHGFSQKLGDAAAGKEGLEAVEAIKKVADGIVKGDFTVRVPAAEKITKKGILDIYTAMPAGKEKDIFKATLEKLGIKVG